MPRPYRILPIVIGIDLRSRISTIVAGRRLATQALADVLTHSGPGAGEAGLVEQWRDRLQAAGRFRPDGWYVPPPHGMSILIGESPAYDRVDFATLRAKGQWPDPGIRLSDASVLCAYASPIDRTRPGLISDVGVTLYRGDDAAAHDHLARCLAIIAVVVRQIDVGMTFARVDALLQEQIDRTGVALSNRIWSPTDSTGVNIGHTMPWSYEEPTVQELALLTGDDDEARSTCISRKRQFVNAASSFEIPPTVVFSIEPRLASPGCPTPFFHCIVVFRDSERSVVSGYRQLFDALDVARHFDSADVAMLDDAVA
jgi:hypothetical protein